MNLYKELEEKLQKEQKLILATRLKNTAGSIANHMERQLWSVDDIPSHLKESAEEVLFAGSPRMIKSDNSDELFLEPFYKEERLIVFGGGHIALPVVEFGARIGFSVTVVDDRQAFANSNRFPLASHVLCESFENAIDKLNINETDYLVVITRGHRHDAACIRQLIKYDETIYLGMIGSNRRVTALKKQLIEEGYDSQRLERICTPIGLRIGAITPEEIGISILAEIIERKRLGKTETAYGRRKYINRSDLDFHVIRHLANNTGEKRSIVTVISALGSVPRGPGAKMIVFPNGRILGSIGGGCSEGAVIQNAMDIIGSGEYQIQTIDMTGDVAEDEGMVCGGVMKVLIEDDIVHDLNK